VLPDGVIQHNFYRNGIILHACVHGRRKDFFQEGAIGFFPKVFLGGLKVAKFVFYHSKLRKQPFLLSFQISSPLPTPMLVCRQSSCHTIKTLV